MQYLNSKYKFLEEYKILLCIMFNLEIKYAQKNAKVAEQSRIDIVVDILLDRNV